MVRVLIIGTGGMAHDHAKAYAAMEGVRIVGGVDPDAERCAAFSQEFGIAHQFASLDDALAWGEFDAASNVTPDKVHYRTTMPLLAAGKHVLCEKPLAVNAADAAEMADAAANAGVINMINLSYRNVPALIKGAEMVAAGAVGEVRHFEASYLQSWLTQPAWGDWRTETQWLWRLSTAHGSLGVLGDVGVHIIDFATFAAAATISDVSCRLTTFDKAEDNRIADYDLDANDSFSMHFALSNGAAGVIHASRFASGHLNDLRLRLYGTRGGLEILFENSESQLRVCAGDNLQTATWEDIDVPAVPTNYVRFINAIRTGQQVRPDFARGAELQRVLDQAVASDAQGCQSLPV